MASADQISSIQRQINESVCHLESLTVSEIPPHPLAVKGFINPQNNCYQNVFLQVLFHQPIFCKLLEALQPLDKCPAWAESTAPILICLRKIYVEYKSGSVGQVSSEPKLCKVIDAAEGTQQDAEEFAIRLLDNMHEELRKLCGRSESSEVNQNSHAPIKEADESTEEDGDDGWTTVCKEKRVMKTEIVQHMDLSASLISQHFSGSTIMAFNKATEVKHSGHVEAFWALSLDISNPSIRSVYEALRHFFLTRELMSTCSGERNTFMFRLPHCLNLQLKRFLFHNNRISKVKKWVSIPMQLLIPQNMMWNCKSTAPQDADRTYRLHSVVFHRGEDTHHGHYIVALYSVREQLFHVCDDTNVHRLDPAAMNLFLQRQLVPKKLTKELADCDPYLVTYVRTDKPIPLPRTSK